MPGFAEEVKQSQARTPAPATAPQDVAPAASAAPDTAAPAAAEAPAASPTDFLNTGLPVGSVAVDKTAVAEADKTRKPDVADELPKIKIAGKEFASMEAAIAYAEELELAKREDDAFKDGYQKAKATDAPAVVPPTPLEKKIAEKFFEDPEAALKEYREAIKKEIFETYDKMVETQSAQKTQAENVSTMWNDFYSANTDLVESRGYVDYVLKQNWDKLGVKPVSEALKELAELSRKALRITKVEALPAKELQSKPAIMAGVTAGATQPAAEDTEEAPVDFVTQMSKIRKRK